MFEECVIGGRRFAPARFCAPLVGYTHSAFRRLIAELGGCGGIWTEMLAGRQILSENFSRSPWLRRHPQESCLVYQLMIGPTDPIERVLGRLVDSGAEALDINLACNSLTVRSCSAGATLFEDIESLRLVVQKIRKLWPHVLTAKVRFGHQRPGWESRFEERLRLFEESGIDAVTLHARFVEERFKRRARHELFTWAASLTRLPLIANGDLTGPGWIRERSQDFQSVSAIMVGRMAVAQPWIFAHWDQPGNVDLAAIWDRMFELVNEEFQPGPGLRRLQMFTKYFATNFKFGHQFNVELGRATSLEEIRQRAAEFFSRSPETVSEPIVAGL